MEENIIVIEKPVGMPVSGHENGYLTVTEWYRLYFNTDINTVSNMSLNSSGLLLCTSRDKTLNTDPVFTYTFLSEKKVKCSDGNFKLLKAGGNSFLYESQSLLSDMNDFIQYTEECGFLLISREQHPERLFIHCRSVLVDKHRYNSYKAVPDSFLSYMNSTEKVLHLSEISLERRLPLIGTITDSCRLLHRNEIQGVDLSIDKYGDFLHIQNYSVKTAKDIYTKYSALFSLFEKRLSMKGGCIKNMLKDPHNSSLIGSYYEWGDIPNSFRVNENECEYEIRLNKKQHTGLFLDQKDNRALIKHISSNKRVLNLFSFTCSFSVIAAKNDAEVVFSLDLAKSSLKRGRRNFEINRLTESGIGKFIEADVIVWLQKNRKKALDKTMAYKPWDVVICDPPVFAMAGKKQSFHIEEQWEFMAESISVLLCKNGLALFSNNHKDGRSDKYKKILMKYFGEVIERKPSLDFPDTGYSHIRMYHCRYPVK